MCKGANVLEGPLEKIELEKLAGLAGVWQLQTWESTQRQRNGTSWEGRRDKTEIVCTRRDTWKILAAKQMNKGGSDFRGAGILTLKPQSLLFSEMESLWCN